MNKEQQSTSRSYEPSDPLDEFYSETEEMFYERFHSSLITIFVNSNTQFREVSHNGLLLIYSKHNKAYDDVIVIRPRYHTSNKTIDFETTLATLKIPLHKMAAVAEFVHRLNDELDVNGYVLDFKNRCISFRSTVIVGHRAIVEKYVNDHLQLVEWASDVIPFIEDIIIKNETPEAVVKDYFSFEY